MKQALENIGANQVIDTLHLITMMGGLTGLLYYVANIDKAKIIDDFKCDPLVDSVDVVVDEIIGRYRDLISSDSEWHQSKLLEYKPLLTSILVDVKAAMPDVWLYSARFLLTQWSIANIFWLLRRSRNEAKLIIMCAGLLVYSYPTLDDDIPKMPDSDLPAEDAIEDFMKNRLQFLYDAVPSKDDMLDRVIEEEAMNLFNGWGSCNEEKFT